MSKTSNSEVLRFIEEWEDQWYEVQSFRARELIDKRHGRKVFRVAELDAKEKLRKFTARISRAAAERGVDATAIRDVLSDLSRRESAFLVLDELMLAATGANDKSNQHVALTPRQQSILDVLSKLKRGRGLEGKEIADKLPKRHRKAESTLRRHDFPELLKSGLVVNTSGVGYHLPTKQH